MDPRAFTEACKRLGSGEFDPETVEQLRIVVEERMPVRYAVPFPPDVQATFYRSGSNTRTRRGQWHELVQHLTDLTYLTADEFQQWHQARAADLPPTGELMDRVLAALGAFVAEDAFAPLHRGCPYPAAGRQARLDWAEEYLTPAVDRLSTFTSFDGELAVNAGYRLGDRSVYGRSMAFRMYTLFTYVYADQHRRDVYLDESDRPLIIKLNRLLARDRSGLDEGLQGLLLNAGALLEAFWRARLPTGTDGENTYILYRITGPPSPDSLALEEALRTELANRRQLRELPEILEYTGGNDFARRLLQLTLWRIGYYDGALDSDFGPRTHEALLRFLEQESEGGRRRKIAKILVRREGEGAYAVKLRPLGKRLRDYAPPDKQEARNLEDDIWKRIAEARQIDTVDQTFAERQQEATEAYGAPQRHPFRRVYFAVGSLLRAALRGIARIIDWIRRAVSFTLGAIFDFIKLVAKRLREGVGLFFTGMRFFANFFLGRPVVTPEPGSTPVTVAALTRFGLDFDTVNYVADSAGAEAVRDHGRLLRRLAAGAEFFLTVAITVVRAAAAWGTPLGWIHLGVLIARWVLDMLRSPQGAKVSLA
ncbi:peptidoglycan-binding domain-containing protein [Lewinella sp. IMCC34183]|uniref:peptidoglycan-binding domain-containing protein n=1 Tax=Lewinella sp. IMCC34183 TaxID=2248762 RepID=UPI000E23DF05|nr:peptidoglycan-binding domain-containing protein [Lewinella sp. IMCC34183]